MYYLKNMLIDYSNSKYHSVTVYNNPKMDLKAVMWYVKGNI